MYVETKYYVCGHTAKGFVNYLESNLKGINQIISLKHPAKCVKTAVIKQFMEQTAGAQEVLSNPYSNQYLDGVIIRSANLAILSDSIVMDGIHPTRTIDLMDSPCDEAVEDIMTYLNAIITASYEAAYRYFAKGLEFHEALEEVYLREMDFVEADRLANDFIATLFRDQKVRNHKSLIKERLFGTNTSDGIVNHLQEIIDTVENRVFIKGRAGTGKSVFMKKILAECVKYGFDAEIYHCSFDPESIDMLIIRDLDYCLFDSTAPHELFPSRSSDVIMDLYEKAVTPLTDEKYATEINELMSKYKREMHQGLALLKNTKETEAIIDRLWTDVIIKPINFQIGIK